MNIVHEFLKSTVPGDFRYPSKRNGPNSRRTLVDALKYAFFSIIKSSDTSALRCFNEENIRQGLIEFLTVRGFHANEINPPSEKVGRPLINESSFPLFCERVIDDLCIEICKTHISQSFNKAIQDENVAISDEIAKIIRSNFSQLSNNLSLNFNQTLPKKRLGGRLKSGLLHPVYGEKNVACPSLEEMAAIFASDPYCALEMNEGAHLHNDHFISVKNLPVRIKHHPILAAACLINHLDSHRNVTSYYPFNSERHIARPQSVFQDALEITSVKNLTYLSENLNETSKLQIYRRLAGIAINVEDLETLLHDEQKSALSLARTAGPKDLDHAISLIRLHDRNVINEQHNINEIDEIDERIASAISDALMIVEGYNFIEELSKNALDANLKHDEVVQHLQSIFRFFFQLPIMNAACIAQPFVYTKQFINKHFSKHQNLCLKIIADAPHSFASSLVTSQDIELNTVAKVFNLCKDPKSHSRHEVMVTDYKTNQIAKLLADIELTHPGFIKDFKIDIEDVFNFREYIDEIGLKVFHQLLSEQKISVINNIPTGNEDMSFLAQSGGL